jgi:hypothetical protein
MAAISLDPWIVPERWMPRCRRRAATSQGMVGTDRQPARVIRDTVPGESARNVAIAGVSSKVT